MSTSMTSLSTISPPGQSEIVKPQPPIVFLDIDGVLNSVLYMTQHPRRNPCIDERCVKLLNELTDRTGCKYVISSTWRRYNTLEAIQEIFNKKGFTGELIGTTLNLQTGEHGDCILRGNEILQWIKANVGIFYSEYKRYVIFDDDSDMLYWQKDNFICTDGYVGLTPKNIYKARMILGDIKKISDPPY